MQIVENLLNGNRLALARVISFIEDRGEYLRPLVDELYIHSGKAFILGITGPPGAGKSTVTDKLVAQLRKNNLKVAVVAIDPSSPFSGGAILGDRIRMQAHADDTGVFIRSLGTRGKHGGLSLSTKEVVMAFDAAGFDWVIVETAGVGQTELDILKLAHCVSVVLVPESGDSIQVMKAGLMEIADIFVVNKSDRPEADKLVKELVTMVGLNDAGPSWQIPVIKTQAVFDNGIDTFYKQVVDFKAYAHTHTLIEQKQMRYLQEELIEILTAELSQKVLAFLKTELGKKILADLKSKKLTPYKAADKITQKL